MNIKNLKNLKEAKAYPEDMLRGMNYLVEDIPPPDNARCIPYHSTESFSMFEL